MESLKRSNGLKTPNNNTPKRQHHLSEKNLRFERLINTPNYESHNSNPYFEASYQTENHHNKPKDSSITPSERSHLKPGSNPIYKISKSFKSSALKTTNRRYRNKYDSNSHNKINLND